MSSYIIRKLVGITEKEINKKIKKKYKYLYTDSEKQKIKISSTLEKYINQWRIPPAYPIVKIFLGVDDSKDDTYYAIGTDLKGRSQYLYTTYHNTISNYEKYCKLVTVGQKYKEIFSKIQKDLQHSTFTKEKLIALLLLIMIKCQFRPGHKKYKQEYGSIGLTTLQKKHITERNNKIEIKFIGKKGVINECTLTDKKIISELSKLIQKKKKNDTIFSYGDISIEPTDINNYLPQTITAKNIRTWDANVEFIKGVRKFSESLADTKKKRKKQLTNVIKNVASKLHHSIAICKKSYIDTALTDMFMDEPLKFTYLFIHKRSIEKSLISFFKNKCL